MAIAAAAVVLAPAAEAGEGLFVGVSDDIFGYEPAFAYPVAHDLGLRSVRLTLRWHPAEASIRPADELRLDAAVNGAAGLRVVVAVYGSRDDAPTTPAAREAYCAFVRELLVRYPLVNDVVIWNEPNLTFFWKPQFNADGTSAAPAAYYALAARCWDVLHELRPDVNVIAPATSPNGNDDPYHPHVSAHRPETFIRRLGDAYRASGRRTPIFDTVGQHVYGDTWSERPWKPHSGGVAQGDHDRLLRALKDAFVGTGQPAPGAPAGGRGATIWYLESGFETVPSKAKASLYFGTEAYRTPIADSVGASVPLFYERPDAYSSAPDQATQLVDATRLAYCQSYVEAIFNFVLRDEPDLGGWQTGVLWADGTPKGSYAAWRAVVHEVNDRATLCRRPLEDPAEPGASPVSPTPPAPPPAGDPGKPPAGGGARSSLKILRLSWPTGKRFGRRHPVWRLRLEVDGAARYDAAILASNGGITRVGARGSLRARSLSLIRLRNRGLVPGRYRIRLVVRAAEGSKPVTLRGPLFRVVTGQKATSAPAPSARARR